MNRYLDSAICPSGTIAAIQLEVEDFIYPSPYPYIGVGQEGFLSENSKAIIDDESRPAPAELNVQTGY